MVQFLMIFVFGLIPCLLLLGITGWTVFYALSWNWMHLALAGGMIGTVGIIAMMVGVDKRISSLSAHLTALAMVIGLLSTLPIFAHPFYLANPFLWPIFGPIAIAIVYLYGYGRGYINIRNSVSETSPFE